MARERTSRPARRAFTMLEVVIAVTVMGLLTLLISALNAQLRDWSEDAAESAQTLTVQRAVEFMRDQWSGRVQISGRDPSLQTSPEYVSFVTSRPALDPSFPVVRATYRWAPRESDRGETVYDLLYEETPVAGIAIDRRREKSDEEEQENEQSERQTRADDADEQAQEEADARDRVRAEIDAPAHTWPLIKGCSKGEWERYGQGGIVLRNDEASLTGASPTAEYTLAGGDVIREEREQKWRAYDEEIPKTARAVRLSGEHGEEVFTCVFVTADSR